MQQPDGGRTGIDVTAVRLAFQIGHNLAGFLLDQAGRLAAQQVGPDRPAVVTVEHIAEVVARCLPEALRGEMGVSVDGPTTRRRQLSA